MSCSVSHGPDGVPSIPKSRFKPLQCRGWFTRTTSTPLIFLVQRPMSHDRFSSPPRGTSRDRFSSPPGASTSFNARAKSPALYNETSTDEGSLYQTAMKKVYEASWRFDRGKNGDFLKTLDNKKLPKDLFRQIVRVGMDLKLTPQELDVLLPLFNNDGEVDGCEFILIFYRLRYEHRSKVFTERVQRQKRTKEVQKIQQEKLQEQFEGRVHVTLVDSYTAEHLDSAMKKVIEAAVKYDRLMPGTVQLDAFDCEYMSPNVFKEQMKLVFNVNLTVEELSAFIKNFNKDNADGENINCAAFLVSFFRAGFQERTNRLHGLWKEKRRIEEERRMKELQQKREQEMKNALKVNYDFTEADKERAILKQRTAARLYDKTTPGAMSMKAFEVKEMAPHVFKEQLKRIFNLQVTPPEMGALMAVFDVNGDGVITCEEFTKVFLHMGFVEREKELKDAIEKQKRAEARRAQLEEEKRIALENKNNLKVSYAYTEEEMQSAMRKLTEAAWRYDKLMPGAPCLDAFEKRYMEPHVLKEQLKKAFYMKVTPQELGAIVHYFDTNNTGLVDCECFLKKFFKTGFDERQRQKVEWREHQKQVQEALERQQAVKQKEKDDKISFATVDHSYTEADFQSAFQKLTTGAMKYDRSGAGAVGLDAFEAVSMPPHVFKEQLKLVFNVNVTLPELWALVAYFDRERTGVVNCKHFLTQFLRTGLDERIRIQQGWHKEKEAKREKDRQLEAAREADKERRAWAEVDFDFLEFDFDSMLAKLVDLCFNFDRRQLGPAGLAAFEVDSLTPAEFREMLKRTFNLKLTSRELGAMVAYFDSRGKRVADCAMFLNAVVQIRVQCEEFKGKKNEAARRAQYVADLKEQYKSRMARSMSVDARPWRHNAVLVTESRLAKSVVKQAGPASPPKTPMEKYKLRISVGRRTGRMDLACRAVWPSEEASHGGGSHASLRAGSHASLSTAQMAAGVQDGSEVTDVDGEGFFLTQESQDGAESVGAISASVSASAPAEMQGPEDEASIFEQVADSRHGNAEEEAALAEASVPATSSAASPGSTRKLKSKPKEMMIDFRLSVVPKEVLRLTELTELWLCNNVISVIPPGLGELKQLTTLSFNNNKLDFLSPEICQLVNLKRLQVRGNSLQALPNLLGQLQQLQVLDCARNKFSTFPEVLTSMPRLVHLDFAHNRIAALPGTLEALQQLVYLSLQDNGFTKPQPVLLRMPWLEVLGVPLSEEGRGSREWAIGLSDEHELLNLLKSRAAASLTAKLRRKKKKSSYL